MIGSGGNLDWLKGALSAVGITSDSGLQTVDSAVCGARVYNSAAISIPSAAWTALTFDSERFDLYDNAASTFHSTVSNTDRLTVPAGLGGYYLVGGHIEFAANTTGRRGIQIVHSVGSAVIAEDDESPTNAAFGLSVSTLWSMAVGEYVTLQVYQNSGGALNVNASARYSAEFWIVRVGV